MATKEQFISSGDGTAVGCEMTSQNDHTLSSLSETDDLIEKVQRSLSMCAVIAAGLQRANTVGSSTAQTRAGSSALGLKNEQSKRQERRRRRMTLMQAPSDSISIQVGPYGEASASMNGSVAKPGVQRQQRLVRSNSSADSPLDAKTSSFQSFETGSADFIETLSLSSNSVSARSRPPQQSTSVGSSNIYFSPMQDTAGSSSRRTHRTRPKSASPYLSSPSNSNSNKQKAELMKQDSKTPRITPAGEYSYSSILSLSSSAATSEHNKNSSSNSNNNNNYNNNNHDNSDVSDWYQKKPNSSVSLISQQSAATLTAASTFDGIEDDEIEVFPFQSTDNVDNELDVPVNDCAVRFRTEQQQQQQQQNYHNNMRDQQQQQQQSSSLVENTQPSDRGNGTMGNISLNTGDRALSLDTMLSSSESSHNNSNNNNNGNNNINSNNSNIARSNSNSSLRLLAYATTRYVSSSKDSTPTSNSYSSPESRTNGKFSPHSNADSGGSLPAAAVLLFDEVEGGGSKARSMSEDTGLLVRQQSSPDSLCASRSGFSSPQKKATVERTNNTHRTSPQQQQFRHTNMHNQQHSPPAATSATELGSPSRPLPHWMDRSEKHNKLSNQRSLPQQDMMANNNNTTFASFSYGDRRDSRGSRGSIGSIGSAGSLSSRDYKLVPFNSPRDPLRVPSSPQTLRPSQLSPHSLVSVNSFGSMVVSPGQSPRSPRSTIGQRSMSVVSAVTISPHSSPRVDMSNSSSSSRSKEYSAQNREYSSSSVGSAHPVGASSSLLSSSSTAATTTAASSAAVAATTTGTDIGGYETGRYGKSRSGSGTSDGFRTRTNSNFTESDSSFDTSNTCSTVTTLTATYTASSQQPYQSTYMSSKRVTDHSSVTLSEGNSHSSGVMWRSNSGSGKKGSPSILAAAGGGMNNGGIGRLAPISRGKQQLPPLAGSDFVAQPHDQHY